MISLILIIIILLLSIRNYQIISSSISQVLEVFIFILVPSLFFMIIVSKLLKSNSLVLKFIAFISRFLRPILHFESDVETYIFIFSLLSGNPTSQILIDESYKKHEISKDEANRLSCFLCFSSPVYLYKTASLLSPKTIAPIFVTSYLIPILGLMITKPKNNIKSASNIEIEQITLNDAILDASSSLFRIFSFVFFFTVLFNMLQNEFHFTPKIAFLISNLLDLTVSISHPYSFNLLLDMFFFILFNTFLGLSIHLQIKSCASFLDYKRFLISRIILSIISGIFIVLYYIFPYIILFVPLVFLIKRKERSRKNSTSTV